MPASSTTPALAPTRAAVTVARCQRSWWSVSDTAAPKRLWSCALRPAISLRLPFRLPFSGKCRWISTRQTELIDDVVDDRVGPDLDALPLGHRARVADGANVEADDHGVGCGGQHHVGLGDTADAVADHVDRDLLLRQLRDLVGQRLERPGDVGLHHERQLLKVALLGAGEDVFERDPHALAPGQRLRLQAVGAVAGLLAGLAVVLHHADPLARLGHAVEAEHLDGIAPPCLLDTLAAVVVHCPHAAPV